MMKSFISFIFFSLLTATTVLGRVRYSIKGTHHGRPMGDSQLVLRPISPHLHRLNMTGHDRSRPSWSNRNSTDSPDRRRKTRYTGAEVDKRSNLVSYSNNWCGACHHTPSSNPIKSIHAYFQVPQLRPRTGGEFPQYLAPWVGIDGATYGSALLQAGTTSMVSGWSRCIS
jgi:hypothetical protein